MSTKAETTFLPSLNLITLPLLSVLRVKHSLAISVHLRVCFLYLYVFSFLDVWILASTLSICKYFWYSSNVFNFSFYVFLMLASKCWITLTFFFPLIIPISTLFFIFISTIFKLNIVLKFCDLFTKSVPFLMGCNILFIPQIFLL